MTNNISIVFSGDIFLQRQILNSYYDVKSKKYLFPEEIFKDIKDEIKGDLSCVVLDTVIAGNIFTPSSYPLYNAPCEILDIIKNLGYNLVITANNHCLDKGERGLLESIKNIKKRNLLYLGTNLSPDPHERILIFDKNGIKAGILAYTYGTNGIHPSKNKEYIVNYINLEKISKDIHFLKNQKVDSIIVYLHWGEEYREKPAEYQRELAKKLINLGVDFIVGSHSHCIGTIEKINNTYCFYSLGNFFADQYGLNMSKTKFGLILRINLFKIREKMNYKLEVIPIFIYRKMERGNYKYKIIKAINIYKYRNIKKEDFLYYEGLKKLLGSTKWEKDQELYIKL
ncbi:MAG: CapA family protein [Dictyoglomaceae bacterium]|nr:CapA family protein [Dictyoglomaceae bacterium]